MKRQVGIFKKTTQKFRKPLNIEEKVTEDIYLIPFTENIYNELTGIFVDKKRNLIKLEKKLTIKENLDKIGINLALIGRQDKVLLYEGFRIDKKNFSLLFIEVTNIYFKSEKLIGFTPVNFSSKNVISLLAFSILLSL